MVENNEDGLPLELEYGEFKFIKKLSQGGLGIVALYETFPPIGESKSKYPHQVAIKLDLPG